MEMKSIGPKARELMSPEQLADYLGCGRTYAYQLLAENDIPSLKLGRLRRIRRVDVDRFIEGRMAATQRPTLEKAGCEKA